MWCNTISNLVIDVFLYFDRNYLYSWLFEFGIKVQVLICLWQESIFSNNHLFYNGMIDIEIVVAICEDDDEELVKYRLKTFFKEFSNNWDHGSFV